MPAGIGVVMRISWPHRKNRVASPGGAAGLDMGLIGPSGYRQWHADDVQVRVRWASMPWGARRRRPTRHGKAQPGPIRAPPGHPDLQQITRPRAGLEYAPNRLATLRSSSPRTGRTVERLPRYITVMPRVLTGFEPHDGVGASTVRNAGPDESPAPPDGDDAASTPPATAPTSPLGGPG